MRSLLTVLAFFLFLNGHGAEGVTEATRTTPPVGYSSVVQPRISQFTAQQIIRLSTAQYLKSVQTQQSFEQQFRSALLKREAGNGYTRNAKGSVSKLSQKYWDDLSTSGMVLVGIGILTAVVGIIVLEQVVRNQKR